MQAALESYRSLLLHCLLACQMLKLLYMQCDLRLSKADEASSSPYADSLALQLRHGEGEGIWHVIVSNHIVILHTTVDCCVI